MKKTIVLLGMALVTFTNAAIASTENTAATITTAARPNVTPLCAAISKGDFSTVKKFIEYGADVNETSNDMTPLMIAARYNNVEIIDYLVSKGANVNYKGENGMTALKCAVNSNAKDAEAMLRQKGAKR